MNHYHPFYLYVFVFLLIAGCAGPRFTIHPVDGIPYPPMEVSAEDIYHVPTGLKLSFDEAVDMISGALIVYIGEMHSNVHAHRVELTIIRELFNRFPDSLAIGMEMFRDDQQEALNRWIKGELTELSFLRESRWYDNWGSDFGYYRDILEFAREKGIDVIALNPSKKQQNLVKMTGLDKLPADVKAMLPEIDDSDPYARAVAEAVYADHLPTEGMFAAFYRVQALWEESMSERIVQYLQSSKGLGKKMVVIAGGWHVMYGFGVPKKVIRRMPVPYTIVIPEEISLPEEKLDVLTMDVDIPELPLLKADFVWMVPYDDLEDKRLRMGIMMSMADDRVTVMGIEEGSPAEKAGIKKGDVIVSFDGHPVTEIGDLRYYIGEKEAGDEGNVTVMRDGQESSFTVNFFLMTEGVTSR